MHKSSFKVFSEVALETKQDSEWANKDSSGLLYRVSPVTVTLLDTVKRDESRRCSLASIFSEFIKNGYYLEYFVCHILQTLSTYIFWPVNIYNSLTLSSKQHVGLLINYVSAHAVYKWSRAQKHIYRGALLGFTFM
jgi:hypothetical protein